MDVRQRVRTLIEGLCQGLYEREEPMKLALLSTVAGESIFLLGPPGVGKSLIARRLKFAFEAGTSFEYLMSRFSTPDEIFGPVSIKKLKEEDRYERLTDKYLPGANIVFLDEIWKAGPAIQNALLTILNEKVYRNGEQEVQVNIKGIITASNELPPAQESFLPLWDRFLVRYEMNGIRDKGRFLQMITDTRDVYKDDLDTQTKLDLETLREWDEGIDAVELPPAVLNTIQVVRHKIEQANGHPHREVPVIKIFDRRWKKIVRLLRTSAFLNGRKAVDLMDCFLMVPCLWGDPRQVEEIQEIVSESIRKHGYSIAINLGMLRKEVEEFEQEIDEEIRLRRTIAEDRLLPVQDVYYRILQKEKQFQGDLIKVAEYNGLDTENFQVVNIYDQSETLRHRLKARKSTRPHALEINFNSVEYQHDLETHKVERQEVIYKQPHRLVIQHWNERYEQLIAFISQQQAHLTAESTQHFQQLADNLFVEAKRVEIIRANLSEVQEVLKQLNLRLEKIKYEYEHVQV